MSDGVSVAVVVQAALPYLPALQRLGRERVVQEGEASIEGKTAMAGIVSLTAVAACSNNRSIE